MKKIYKEKIEELEKETKCLKADLSETRKWLIELGLIGFIAKECTPINSFCIDKSYNYRVLDVTGIPNFDKLMMNHLGLEYIPESKLKDHLQTISKSGGL